MEVPVLVIAFDVRQFTTAGGGYSRERKNVNDTSGLFTLHALSVHRDVRRMTMVVVMLDFDQRPTECLSEAVANPDRLYLHLVDENSNFGLFSMTACAMAEPLERHGYAIGRNRETRSRYSRRRGVQEFTVDGVWVDGWNSMTETNTVERRVLFNGRR